MANHRSFRWKVTSKSSYFKLSITQGSPFHDMTEELWCQRSYDLLREPASLSGSFLFMGGVY